MFVRYISHEIRTPLNTVTMGLQYLQELMHQQINKKLLDDDDGDAAAIDCHNNKKNDNYTNYDINNDDVIGTLTQIEGCCNIAIEILNDLLLFDKIGSNMLQLDLEKIPIRHLVEDTIQPFFLPVRIYTLYVYAINLIRKLCNDNQ